MVVFCLLKLLSSSTRVSESSSSDTEESSEWSSSSPVMRVRVWPRAVRCFPISVSTCTSTPVICH